MNRNAGGRRGLRRRGLLCAAATLTLAARGAPAAEPIGFDSLYDSIGVLGIRYSERAKRLVGKAVSLRGYMAPPLKPESHFFVLTHEPVAICPFCSSDADWPLDIVVVYLKDTLAPVDFNRRIEASGRLEIGSWTDPQTGFVSQVRIVDAEVREVGRR